MPFPLTHAHGDDVLVCAGGGQGLFCGRILHGEGLGSDRVLLGDGLGRDRVLLGRVLRLLLQPRLKRQGLGIEGRLIGRGSSTLRLLLEVSSASRHSSIRCDECGVRTAPGSAESGADSEHSEHEE